MNPLKVLEPKEETLKSIQELFWGFAPACIIGTAVKLRLFPLLTTPRSAQEMAEEKGLSVKGTYRLLNALKKLGILDREEGRFFISEKYKPLFDPASLFYLGDFFIHATTLQQNWLYLDEVVTTGKPIPKEKKDPRFFAVLAKGLFGLNWSYAMEVAKKHPVESGKVLDVAGGSGVWSAALLIQNPNLEGVVLDMPSVIAHAAKPVLSRLGLKDRYSFIEGDLFSCEWGKDYSAVILGHICHSFGEEGILAMLKRCKEALDPKGKVIIVDFMRESNEIFPAVFSINMLLATPDGDVHSEEEYLRWLQTTGFKMEKQISLPSLWPCKALIAGL